VRECPELVLIEVLPSFLGPASSGRAGEFRAVTSLGERQGGRGRGGAPRSHAGAGSRFGAPGQIAAYKRVGPTRSGDVSGKMPRCGLLVASGGPASAVWAAIYNGSGPSSSKVTAAAAILDHDGPEPL